MDLASYIALGYNYIKLFFTECRYNQYLCEDEIGCVNRSDICNGVKDCRDGSDEDDCSK